MPADEEFMREAIRQARKGVGATHPNPAVGAVIVSEETIVARGWHRSAGTNHAEIEALKRARQRAHGATLYVTLEPCSTQGRTPPCTHAIVEAGIARVVYGATDPNPKHCGRAATFLSRAGIEVCAGVLAEPCAALNTEWNKWISRGMPYVIAKAAMTLDGRINSPPESRWITSEASRQDAMKLRSRSGRLPPTAKILTDQYRDRTLVMKGMSLRSALRELGSREIAAVLIEGGGRVIGEAFDASLVDEVCFYMAPILVGGATPVTGGRGVGDNEHAVRLGTVLFKRIGSDVRLTATVLKK